ncbi:MAG: N-acetyltransferase family protein, partial [Bauldia litoralis]
MTGMPAAGAASAGTAAAVPSAVVRPAGEDDVPAIQAIYGHHVVHGSGSFELVPPELDEMARRRADIVGRGMPYLVAEQDGRVVGFAYAAPYRPRAAYRYTVEDSVYVAPDAIGGGVGTAQLAALIETCTAMGFRQMVAVIGDSENRGSMRLHEKAGFTVAGTLKAVGYKFDRWVDSVTMQRALGAGSKTQPPGGG